MVLKNFYYMFFIAAGLFLSSCVPKQEFRLNYAIDADLVILKKDVNITFIPANNHIPSHLQITKTERYRFLKSQAPLPFKKEITVGPLMYDMKLSAQIQKNGKVDRTIQAQKVAQTVMSQNQRTWSPARTKLALNIPYVKSDEEVVVSTTYSWMDIRWHNSISLEEDVPTLLSEVIVDVPYGISSQFQSTRNGELFSLSPQTMDHEKTVWGQKDNQAGLGTRFIFSYDFGQEAASRDPSARLQLFFSFEPPTQNLRTPPFDNWERVASYLYDRIDRYDYPSNTIREFTRKEADAQPDNFKKLGRILSFLSNEIETRPVFGSYLEQDVQPAPKTFARRFGSPFDKAILGKAMLMSIGIDAEIMAASDKTQNPSLPNFYSPALFNRVILATTLHGRTYFWDPSIPFVELEPLPLELYAARLLSIRSSKGRLFTMPARVPNIANLEPYQEAVEVHIPMDNEEAAAKQVQEPVAEEKSGFVIEHVMPSLELSDPKDSPKPSPEKTAETNPIETTPLIEEHKPKVEDFKPTPLSPKEELEPKAEEPKPNIEEPKSPPAPLLEQPVVPSTTPAATMKNDESASTPVPLSPLESDSLFEDRASLLNEPAPEVPNAPEKAAIPPKR